ncbi:Stage II sporulation protein M [Pelotomaculum sp. FP]|uniref:stage II sporulation protein M n=1 Tax=Pelotomaculum sp. FP TaxID=261474 RepID=UPI001101CCD2|nr:stage II sporulation protein M [Pelotomaculum sp. FP]TEB17493.1 Stage II sporulation protein M [Pelotomaculum sp. FP]
MLKSLRGFWGNSLRYSWPAYLIVVGVFACGIITGAMGVKGIPFEQAQELKTYLDQFLQQAGMMEVDNTGVLRDVMYNDLVLILEVYLLGLTVIGIPVMLGIIFTRGFVLGYCVAFLTNSKSLQGMALTCAAILPQNIILVPALLMGGVASLCFALLLVKRFYNSKTVIWPSFVIYSGLMCLVLAVSAGAGLVEVYLTPLLVKLTAAYLL